MSVSEVFEEFAREYIKALNELEEEELDKRLEMLEAEVREKLKPLEVEFFVDSYTHEYFTAPSYPREYRYYLIMDVHRVIDKENGRQYFVYVDYHHKQKPSHSEYTLESVEVEEESLIDDERTPFTKRLIEEIPWMLIRDTWLPSIKRLIFELAEAESEGRLEERLEEIVERVKNSLWVYDYQHFYGALRRTAEFFGLSLPEA